MPSPEIEQTLAHLFGLGRLLEARRYEWLNEEEDDFDRLLDVTLIWIAELDDFRVRTSAHQYKSPIVAVVKAKEWKKGEWRKGLLLLPSDSAVTGEEHIGINALTPVDLPDDPVGDILTHLDLSSPNNNRGFDESHRSFALAIKSKVISAEIRVWMARPSDNKNVDDLDYAIRKVVRTLLDTYNSEEMNHFFEQFQGH